MPTWEGENETELVVDGEALLRYLPVSRDQPLADVAVPLAPVARVVPAVLAHLAGWRIATSDTSFASALVAAGCRQVRHAHVFSRDLLDPPPEPGWLTPDLPGLTMRRPGDSVARLVELMLAAYPVGHPDAETSDPDVVARELRSLLDGEEIGPLIEGSVEVVDGDRSAGVVLINRMPGTPPLGGPWVGDICRHPDQRYAGLGSVLLRLAMARLAEHGECSLSLAVTEGNRARATYERLGFEHIQAFRKMEIPAGSIV